MNREIYAVYGGTGHRRLGAFGTHAEARTYAYYFETTCWDSGVAVPRCLIKKEANPDAEG